MPEPAACRSSRAQAGASGMGASSDASTASLKGASLWARSGRQPVHHACFMVARDADSAEDCRRRALFITISSSEPSRTKRASVVVPCVWMYLLALRITYVAGMPLRADSRGHRSAESRFARSSSADNGQCRSSRCPSESARFSAKSSANASIPESASESSLQLLQ